MDALARQVVGEHGGIQIWCNIAGIMVEGPFLDAPEEDLDKILSVNLKGVFFGCQAAGRVMVDQPEGGSIINASSAAADTPSPNIVSYAICKAGVVQMTKSLAVEVGKKHVRVNAVAPGFVLTGMTGRYFVRPDGTVDEEMQEAVVAADAQVHPPPVDRRTRGHRRRRALPGLGRVPVHDRPSVAAQRRRGHDLIRRGPGGRSRNPDPATDCGP